MGGELVVVGIAKGSSVILLDSLCGVGDRLCGKGGEDRADVEV